MTKELPVLHPNFVTDEDDTAALQAIFHSGGSWEVARGVIGAAITAARISERERTLSTVAELEHELADGNRASLAAADLDVRGMADIRKHFRLRSEMHGLDVATVVAKELADAEKHADELAQGLRELSGPCEYPDTCARYQHHRCRSCSEAKLIAPLLAAHAARRAARDGQEGPR